MSKPISARAGALRSSDRAKQAAANRKAQADTLIEQAQKALTDSLGAVRGFKATGPVNHWVICCLNGRAFASVSLVIRRGQPTLKVIPIGGQEFIADNLQALTESIGELLSDYQERRKS